MRKALLLLLLILTCSVVCYSQTLTTVSGKAVDASGAPYANGTGQAIFVPSSTPGAPMVGNSPFTNTTVQISGLDSGGNFSIQLVANGAITPSGSTWKFSFCDVNGINCFTTTGVTISGSTQTVTTAATSYLPGTRVTHLTINVLTSDAETPGSGFYRFYGKGSGLFYKDSTGTVNQIATSAGGGIAFSAITAGTNANALVIGTGGSLTVSGSGTITPSAINLAATGAGGITGQLPIGNVGSAGLSGTSPVAIASTGAISCATCVVASSPGAGIATFAGSTQTAGSGNLSGDVTSSTLVTTLASKYKIRTCQPGLGDGLNAIAAGTYLMSECFNDFGVTATITDIKCFTDNNGTSTLNVTNSAATGLLTGAITCTNAWAAGTQSATVTLASADWAKFTFVADGTTKQTTFVFTVTF